MLSGADLATENQMKKKRQASTGKTAAAQQAHNREAQQQSRS
jgi:hypothetical protein